MGNPYTTPTPPAPRPPDTRPLRKRALVWIGGLGVFTAGALLGTTGSDGAQQPVEAKVAPATTITATATVTSAPAPAPTVTETVRAKAKPRPTVTVTRTAAARAAGTGSNSTSTSDSQAGGGGGDSTGTCSIVSNSGNCYAAGQFCRSGDHGASTTDASGTGITCAYRSSAWRWTYS
ncbi:hypothetical protein [Streptomyces sp. NPDC005423]|uniref:hypothetical protein n=1 Tax=Streptomyces sp. NPDC005423 TaxID=3155343 RepID=UPI0033A2B03B